MSDTVVVLNRRNHSADGNPNDIYNEPEKCRCASLIGESNICDGVMRRFSCGNAWDTTCLCGQRFSNK